MDRSYVDHLVMNNDKLYECLIDIVHLAMDDMCPLSIKIYERIKKATNELDPLDEVM